MKQKQTARAITQMVVRETATDLWNDQSVKGCRTPEDAAKVIRAAMAAEPLTAGGSKESFWVIHLTIKNKVKSVECCTLGVLDASLIHPREVYRGAIAANAAAIILCHNHPSGDTTPSAEDIRITRQLVEAGRIIDIKIQDHLIVAGDGDGFFSMRESGVVQF